MNKLKKKIVKIFKKNHDEYEYERTAGSVRGELFLHHACVHRKIFLFGQKDRQNSMMEKRKEKIIFLSFSRVLFTFYLPLHDSYILLDLHHHYHQHW
jgi:hypothetical protein